MKLNLGAGDYPVTGFISVDRKTGGEVYPLKYPDESTEEIRASHVLEHFSHAEIGNVLEEWVRVLKPGGLLRVAVPDFESVARLYLSGQEFPVQGVVMGGHSDSDDHHGAIFDEESLRDALRAAGLVGITRWQSEIADSASTELSLNLQGYKPEGEWPKTVAVMSVPRLGFMDNFFAAFEGLVPLGIRPVKYTGAFWGQCLTRSIEEVMDGTEYILTLDYDTIFSRNDVEALLSAAVRHSQADAIAALQVSRSRQTPLVTLKVNGESVREVRRDVFEPELTRVSTAHFGLTLIKVEALKRTPKPWFKGEPDEEGRWGKDRIDDDIWFWKQWEKAGNSLWLANRVPVGHAELMVRWPSREMTATYQHPSEFWKRGKPDDVWR